MDGWNDISEQAPPMCKDLVVINFITGEECEAMNVMRPPHILLRRLDELSPDEVDFEVTHWKLHNGPDMMMT